jgi:hypothetical protein
MAAFLDIRPFWGFIVTDLAAAPTVRKVVVDISPARNPEPVRLVSRWQRDFRGHLVCCWEHGAIVASLREKASTGTRRATRASGAQNARANSPERAAPKA